MKNNKTFKHIKKLDKQVQLVLKVVALKNPDIEQRLSAKRDIRDNNVNAYAFRVGGLKPEGTIKIHPYFFKGTDPIIECLAEFIDYNNFNFTTEEYLDVIYFFSNFPFVLEAMNGGMGNYHFHYNGRENIYWNFFEEAVKRNYAIDNAGYNNIQDYFIHIVRQLNKVPKMYFEFSDYYQFIKNVLFDKTLPIEYSLNISAPYNLYESGDKKIDDRLEVYRIDGSQYDSAKQYVLELLEESEREKLQYLSEENRRSMIQW